MAESQECWYAFGINPLEEKLIVVGVAGAEGEAKKKFARIGDEIVYRRVLNLASESGVRELFNWMRSCGVPKNAAMRLLEEFSNNIKEALNAKNND